MARRMLLLHPFAPPMSIVSVLDPSHTRLALRRPDRSVIPSSLCSSEYGSFTLGDLLRVRFVWPRPRRGTAPLSLCSAECISSVLRQDATPSVSSSESTLEDDACFDFP